MSRCVACNASFTPKRKKPVTTFSGTMVSLYTDKVEGFPAKEWEDLCPSCIGAIQNYNADKNDQIATKGFGKDKDTSDCFEWFKPVRDSDIEFNEECEDLRLDVEFSYCEKNYHGGDKYTGD